MAPSKSAEQALPAYEPDEGPLTVHQLARVRRAAKAGAPKGKVLDKRTLL